MSKSVSAAQKLTVLWPQTTKQSRLKAGRSARVYTAPGFARRLLESMGSPNGMVPIQTTVLQFGLTSLLQATKMIFCLRVFYSQTSNLLQLTVFYYYIYFDIFSKIRFDTFDIMKCTNKFIRLCINRSEMFRDYIFTVFVIF